MAKDKSPSEKAAEAEKAGADPTTGEIKTEQTDTGDANTAQNNASAAPGELTPGVPGGLPAGQPQLSSAQLAMMRKSAGKQKFSVKELLIPQLKIVQAISGFVKKSSPDYIKEAEEGDLIDTLNLVPMKPPQTLLIVRFATTYMEAKPDMGPIVKIWGTDSAGYDKAQGGDVGVRITEEGNEIRATASYHCLLLDPQGSSLPCMLYAGGTAWKEARRLNTLLGSFELMSEEGPYIAPPYARLYRVSTVPMSDERNSWMSWKFSPGPLTLGQRFGEALYKKAEDFEESVDKGIVKVHGPVEDDREMARGGMGTRRPTREQGVGPNRGDEPPMEAYADQMGGDADKIQF